MESYGRSNRDGNRKKLPSQHLVLNLAIGGDFVGEPASDTPFPAQFLIDWVRVFQAHEQTDCMGGPCSI
jgi:hypothetical protein